MPKLSRKREEEIKEVEDKLKKVRGVSSIRYQRGTAGNLLKAATEFLPGLKGLVEGLEKSPEFQKRIEEINREIEKKLSEQSFRQAKPRIEHGIRVRPIIGDGESPERRKKIEIKRPQEKEALKQPEPLIDVFEEEGRIKVVAELPGVDLEEIKAEVKGKNLILSAIGFYKEVPLPKEVEEKIEKIHKDAVLEITLKRKQKI